MSLVSLSLASRLSSRRSCVCLAAATERPIESDTHTHTQERRLPCFSARADRLSPLSLTHSLDPLLSSRGEEADQNNSSMTAACWWGFVCVYVRADAQERNSERERRTADAEERERESGSSCSHVTAVSLSLPFRPLDYCVRCLPPSTDSSAVAPLLVTCCVSYSLYTGE